MLLQTHSQYFLYSFARLYRLTKKYLLQYVKSTALLGFVV